ncbi:arginine--tRNA ligase [Bacillus sp. CGMCC 1.16607]|uniref:arginine--tRNA ligase n=1 Tax=Bacillus sp. CGMCC 1.16607 TaxID=3351842 RepID=UPI00363CE8E3
MNYVEPFVNALSEILQSELDISTIEKLIEKPKKADFGDYAFPCFQLAKTRKQAPHLIAKQISKEIQSPYIEKAESVGGYVNVFLNKKIVTQNVLNTIITQQHDYGSSSIGENKVVTIDLSSPNIAKPFSMGHLRSTVIGNAMSHIFQKCGYETIKINHLGDWGTQFGKLITAYKKWGVEEKVKANPIKELLTLYIKFHDEASNDPTLEDAGRAWFKKLEDGDEEALALWSWFREESLKEFSKIYQLLQVDFDSFAGEAFYNDKMDAVVQMLENQGLLMESDQAQVVDLTEENLPPCLIKKSDGATLYATRDLAAALYRKNNYQFEQSLYVVGNEQSLHFKQLKSVLRKMDYVWADNLHHIPFGMMLKDGKKMSTRKGKVILLEEVLAESISLALKNIEAKNPSLQNKEEVSKQVGVGAVIFHDLKNFRMNDIEFSLEDMLRFEGETGPYIQYTNARACSILRKGNWDGDASQLDFENSAHWEIISILKDFSEVILTSLNKFDPSQIAKYAIDLSRAFNQYYSEVRILEDNAKKQARLALVYSVTIVLQESLRLLGIEAPQEM